MWGLNKCRGRLAALMLGVVMAIMLALVSSLFTIVSLDPEFDPGKPCNCPKGAAGSSSSKGGFLRGLFGKKDDAVVALAEKLMERLDRNDPLIVLNITNIQKDGGSIRVVSDSRRGNPRTNELLSHFQPVMDQRQKEALFNAFVKLAEASTINNFTYMMYSGTLLGSYRHHDMVPWDDDLDIFMDYTERKRIVAALQTYAPHYEVRSAGARVKFFSIAGTQTSKYPWKWPYLDISFFKQNATHIWDGSMEDDYGDRYYLYRKEIVFPLHDRPMGPYFFKAPRDSYAHIKRTYGPGTFDACSTSHYSHKSEALTDKIHKIPCESLASHYPFVHRSPIKGGVRETLMLDGKIVHTLIVPEPEYAVTKAYKLELEKRQTPGPLDRFNTPAVKNVKRPDLN